MKKLEGKFGFVKELVYFFILTAGGAFTVGTAVLIFNTVVFPTASYPREWVNFGFLIGAMVGWFIFARWRLGV